MIDTAVGAVLQDVAYVVDWMCSGQTALDVTARRHYDLLLLDLGLPGKDDHAVPDSLRVRDNPVPVLILTARDVVDERICGLDGDADDYILKPSEMVELLARIRVVLHHKDGAASPVLTNGVLTLDPAAHEARMDDAEPIHLPVREFALLQALMPWPGITLSRTELGKCIYGWGHGVASNAVELLVHALRKKLDVQAIKNVGGVGWMVSRGQ